MGKTNRGRESIPFEAILKGLTADYKSAAYFVPLVKGGAEED